jgi:homogentisate 1,2-dioxygenase
MIPQRKGLASRQAHVDLPEGTVEEEHGRQAFTGRASHLYRTAPPTAWVKVEGPLRPWAFDWNQLTPPDQTDPEGDPLVVLSNRDLTVLVSRRSAPMPFFVRDADGDVVYFAHRGEGTLETDYGPLRFAPGDYLVVPKGTTHRVVPSTTDNFFLLIEGDEFVLPDKGLLGHHALFDPGVLETPEPDPLPPAAERPHHLPVPGLRHRHLRAAPVRD